MVSFDKNQNYGQQKHFKLFLMMFDDALQMNVELGVVVVASLILLSAKVQTLKT